MADTIPIPTHQYFKMQNAIGKLEKLDFEIIEFTQKIKNIYEINCDTEKEENNNLMEIGRIAIEFSFNVKL